jgi:hypothetical protein
MSIDEEINQTDSAGLIPKAAEAGNPEPSENSHQVDQEMADEYGFTPEQAKAMGMYL